MSTFINYSVVGNFPSEEYLNSYAQVRELDEEDFDWSDIKALGSGNQFEKLVILWNWE